MQLLTVRVFSHEGIAFLLEARPFLFLGRNHTVRQVFVDKLCPSGDFFIAALHTESHGKTHGATDRMTRDRMVREGIRVLAMVVVAIDRVEQAPHMFTQGVIKNQECISLRATDRLRLLE